METLDITEEFPSDCTQEINESDHTLSFGEESAMEKTMFYSFCESPGIDIRLSPIEAIKSTEDHWIVSDDVNARLAEQFSDIQVDEKLVETPQRASYLQSLQYRAVYLNNLVHMLKGMRGPEAEHEELEKVQQMTAKILSKVESNELTQPDTLLALQKEFQQLQMQPHLKKHQVMESLTAVSDILTDSVVAQMKPEEEKAAQGQFDFVHEAMCVSKDSIDGSSLDIRALQEDLIQANARADALAQQNDELRVKYVDTMEKECQAQQDQETSASQTDLEKNQLQDENSTLLQKLEVMEYERTLAKEKEEVWKAEMEEFHAKLHQLELSERKEANMREESLAEQLEEKENIFTLVSSELEQFQESFTRENQEKVKLYDQVISLEARNAESINQIASLESELQRLRNESSALELTERVATLETRYVKSFDRVDALENKFRVTSDELSYERAEKKRLTEQLQQVTDMYNAQKGQEEVYKQVTALEAQTEALIAQLFTETTQVAQLREELLASETLNTRVTTENEQLLDQTVCLRESLTAANKEIESLQLKLNIQTSKTAKLHEELGQAELVTIDSFKMLQDDLTKLRVECKMELDELKMEFKADKKSMEAKLRLRDDEITRLKEELSQMEYSKRIQEQSHQEAVECRLQREIEQINELRDSLTRTMDEKAKVEEEFIQAESMIQELRMQGQSMQTQLQDSLNTVTRELNMMQAERSDLQEARDTADSGLEQAHVQLNELSVLNATLENRINDLIERNDAMNQKVNLVEQEKKKVDEEKTMLSERMERTIAQKMQLEHAVNELQMEKEQHKDYYSMQQTLDDSRRMAARLEAENTELKKQKQRAEQESDETRTATQELAQYDNNQRRIKYLQTMKNEHTRLKKRIHELEQSRLDRIRLQPIEIPMGKHPDEENTPPTPQSGRKSQVFARVWQENKDLKRRLSVLESKPQPSSTTRTPIRKALQFRQST